MPPTSPKTKSGTKKLSEVARHLVAPADITSTGWPAVHKTCVQKLGISFDDWQNGAGRLILAKRADDNLAAMIDGVGLSVPRQVGKTYLIGAMAFALCVNTPGLLVIWSAHHARTHSETFLAMQGFAKRAKVKAHVKQIFTGSGTEEILFHNGSRILFGARERGFGRGIPGVDILVFDEAQILSDRALSNMLATMNTSRLGLALYIGTPPKPEDMSESFERMRAEALAGTLKDGAWIEFGADPDSDADDRTQWSKANPSYPLRTPAQSILRLRRKLTEDNFLREALGVWDAVASKGVIPGPSWTTQGNEHSIAVDRFALGVECGPDLAWASVAFAGQRTDEKWHFELDEDQHTKGRGVEWLVPHLEYLTTNNSAIRAVVVDVAGPISSLLEQRPNGDWYFKGSTLKATPVKVVELGQGCASVLSGIVTGDLHHIGQPQFTAAALSAGKRPLGDTGMWVWSRKTAESDITPIQAGTLALIGAQNAKVKKPTRQGGGRRVVTV